MKNGKKKRIGAILLVIALVCGIGIPSFGVFALGADSEPTSSPEVTAEPEATATPTPTATPKVTPKPTPTGLTEAEQKKVDTFRATKVTGLTVKKDIEK